MLYCKTILKMITNYCTVSFQIHGQEKMAYHLKNIKGKQPKPLQSDFYFLHLLTI